MRRESKWIINITRENSLIFKTFVSKKMWRILIRNSKRWRCEAHLILLIWHLRASGSFKRHCGYNSYVQSSCELNKLSLVMSYYVSESHANITHRTRVTTKKTPFLHEQKYWKYAKISEHFPTYLNVSARIELYFCLNHYINITTRPVPVCGETNFVNYWNWQKKNQYNLTSWPGLDNIYLSLLTLGMVLHESTNPIPW